jgi:hypothetical protein
MFYFNNEVYQRTLDRIEQLEIKCLNAGNQIMAIKLNVLHNKLKEEEITISDAIDKYLEYLFINQAGIVK